MTPAYAIGCKFPLVDTNEENGSFEVLPGTQYVSDADLQTGLDDVFGKGTDVAPAYRPQRLNLKRGDLWIHDGRAFHRGTPNLTDDHRDELCMAMFKPWMFNGRLHEDIDSRFPKDLWDGLSEHARKVLRQQRVEA